MKSRRDKIYVYGAMLEILLLTALNVTAQTVSPSNGGTAITSATGSLMTYFDDAINLMYVIGGIVGLIGGAKVYSKWSHGDPDTGKTAASWFGACIFLVLVATALKAFFGLT
jgi:uncharacterized membrane protein YfcA